MEQLGHVLLRCALNEINVHALCADACAPNRKLFDNLCQRQIDPNNFWLDEEQTYFPYPYAQLNVFVFHCAVHH
jgi:hypothetical protein